MPPKEFSNIIGFDDAPFPRNHRGDVKIIGTVYAGLRLDGILMGRVRKDGANSADSVARLVSSSKYLEHAQLIMLQGIALGGFNVVDILRLNRTLELPVLVVARRKPDLTSIKRALLADVPGGKLKWKIIEKIGPMEPAHNVFVQRAGLTLNEAIAVIKKTAVHGNIPEPLRTAHLIAGGITLGQSRPRA